MKIHANARTTVKTRALLVDQVVRRGKTRAETARSFGVSGRTVGKWVDRYQRKGAEGLRDRSSSPHGIPHRTGDQRTRRIAKLRSVGLVAWQIAQRLRMAISTVTSVLLARSPGHPNRQGPRRLGDRPRIACAHGLLNRIVDSLFGRERQAGA